MGTTKMAPMAADRQIRKEWFNDEGRRLGASPWVPDSTRNRTMYRAWMDARVRQQGEGAAVVAERTKPLGGF